ncbi:MAG: cyclase family protein, partial [Micropepsaceae bacterium]
MTPRRGTLDAIIDISPEVTPASAVFPGDTEFSSRLVSSMAEGGSCDVGTVTMSLHTGAHADAPSHFSRSGLTIDQMALSAYLGPVRVVDLSRQGAIGTAAIAGIDLRNVQRLLFKTGSAPDP